MSIRNIQKQMVFEETARFYLSNGEKPRLTDVMRDMSEFFSRNPIGRPFSVEPNNIRTGLVSNVDEMNNNIMRSILNIAILYESLLQDTERSMGLYTIAQTRLENLRTRRDKIESDIDDFLLALNNTSGYFYSFSDYFSTLDSTDLDYTSAFVDIASNQVSIPPIAEFSRVFPFSAYTINTTTVKIDGKESAYQVDSPFEGAVDGLSNTNWAMSVSSPSIVEVVVETRIDLTDFENNPFVSKIEIDPFTMVPVQIFIETEEIRSTSGIIREREIFGDNIRSSSNKMTFIDDAREASAVYITMRKTEPDYEIQDNGINKYVYVFGASHLEISRQSFDTAATFVSTPITLPDEIAEDHVIDAVALSIDESKPPNTDITYFIAPDDTTATAVGDFSWREIYPIEDTISGSGSILQLGGAAIFSKFIREKPNVNELQLIAENTSSTDLSKRNPSTVIVSGVDVYRIAKFEEDFIPQTIIMEEGINTTRILTTTLDTTAKDNLAFWTDYINGTNTPQEFYGRIDTGNEFFYGGDIGANNKSVYIETFLDSPIEREPLIKEFRKADANSQEWDVYVYLNGRKIGSLPSGTDTALLPWKFNKGLNHVALTIQIPDASNSFPSPYLGTLDLMVQDDLNAFGTVKLATWSYVDLFTVQYNETGQPKTFTISDNEIISRRKPTTNFRLKYAKPTGHGPTSLRLRADLTRSSDNDSASATLNSYSMRFAYGERR